MKKNIFATFLCLMLVIVVSCKKDPKSDKVDIIETAVDSTAIAAEEALKEKAISQKKKKSTKKKSSKKSGAKKNKKSTKLVRIPGTSASTKNADVQKYIRDYEKYMSNYKKAVEASDMDSFLKLNSASNSLTKQYDLLINKLPGEEIEKLSQYMQVKSKQMNALSAQM
ncbi:hypothetical protein [Aquimarina aggregata]|uniref:hypothetical protein n=1 Tax=Aquimarina aggregata TaxID=1642818 RepID=UPI0024935D94|nr:hypothetical protein [Aquimarina aggregata]